jgi:hypothetical protein
MIEVIIARGFLSASIVAHSKDWHGKPSPEVAAYLLRLQSIARDEPVLLLAHCWAQYAALLAGEPPGFPAMPQHCLISLLKLAVRSASVTCAGDVRLTRRRPDHTADGAARSATGCRSRHSSFQISSALSTGLLVPFDSPSHGGCRQSARQGRLINDPVDRSLCKC